jgi:hypothetical protein
LPGNDTPVASGECRKVAGTTGAYEAYFEVEDSVFVAGETYSVCVTASIDGAENEDVEARFFRAQAAGSKPQPTLELITDALGIVGDTYFVDVVGGSDSTGDGSRALPWKTVTKAVADGVVDGHGDTIVMLPQAAETTWQEAAAVVSAKDDWKLIGAGRSIIWKSVDGSADILALSGRNVEIANCRFSGTGGTSEVAISGTGSGRVIHDCWFEQFQYDTVVELGTYSHLHHCAFEHCAIAGSGDGVVKLIGTSTHSTIIEDSTFGQCRTPVILIDGGDYVTIRRNTFMFTDTVGGLGPYDVQLNSGSKYCMVEQNRLGRLSTILDNGTSNVKQNNEQWATATSIASLGAGTGAAAITLIVKKGGVVTEGVAVTLQASGGTNVQTTDVDGEVVFNRDDGTWDYVIEDTAAYTGSSGHVVIASGVVTSPAGGILTITAIGIPVPTSADNYVVWATERSLDGAATAAHEEVTVTVVDCSDSAMYTAADGVIRRLKGTSFHTDANGQWSFQIEKTAVASGGQITLKRVWTTGEGGQVKSWAKMDASKATAGDQIAWAAWEPKETT